MSNQQSVRVLGYLCRIVEAGERGYAVCAANMDNPGLKILFKSFAQQRAKYKIELLSEIKRLGGNAKPRSSIRGAIHRGRIDIFAALTIGREERQRVILKELILGERVALRAYEKALAAEPPSETRQLISRQYDYVRGLVEQIQMMQGSGETRMIVQLFDTKEDAGMALKAMKDSNVHTKKIEQINVRDSLELYEGRGTTVGETSISGAVGGALWGSLMGGLAGIGAQQTANLVPFDMISIQQSFWPFLSLLVGIVAGALFGAILGFVIGIGISEEDTYLYDRSMKNGQILLVAVVEKSQASGLQRIISQSGLLPPVEETTSG